LYWQLHMPKHRVGPIQSDTQLEGFRQVLMNMLFVVLMATIVFQ
jgi:hypothetical protein